MSTTTPCIRRATIVTIGDELLIGQTIDTNSAWMGQQLALLGVSVVEKVAISDDLPQIVQTVQRCMALSDIVLVTGGLGPTRDDITKASLAEMMGVGMVFDEVLWSDIQGFFARLGRTTTSAHRDQCYLPEGTTKLANKMGTAPGMLYDLQGTLVVSMPGVPYEMQDIMTHGVLPIIAQRADQTIVHHTIQTIGLGETKIAEQIDDIADRLPPHINLAYLPSLGNVKIRISASGSDNVALRQEVATYVTTIEQRLGSIVFGAGKLTIEECVGGLCLQHGLELMTAESCTGGHIASKIVKIPGSSAYFVGSLVTYDNRLKRQLLGVTESTLEQYGAVSEETVRQMVAGGLAQTRADLCVAVSGIAGPTGGTPTKPVGTIWIAVGNSTTTTSKLITAGKNRSKNIEYTATIALNMVRLFIMEQYS